MKTIKSLLFVLFLTVVTLRVYGADWWPSGTNEETFSKGVKFSTGITFESVSTSPTITARTAQKGSVLFNSYGAFYKNDNGSSTNWLKFLLGPVLSISQGGTNSSSALNNNRIMQSSGGAIVESSAITANRALISNASGIPTHSVTTDTELSYVNGVTSAIQTQLNGKEPTLTKGNLTSSTPSLSILGGTQSVIGAGTVLSVSNADTATTGLLTSTDWNTFNNKSGPLTGTSNQITVSSSTGAATLSLPQNIHTGASPTFAGVTVTSASTSTLNASSLTASRPVRSDANKNIVSGQIDLATSNEVTGVLGFANGGTNASTSTAAINGLLPSQSGNENKVLTSNGTNPIWQAAPGAKDWEYIHLNTYAGYGSTDTKIPYFLNTDDSASSANVFTVTTNNSTNGLKITVDKTLAEACVSFSVYSDTGAVTAGISVNSNQLTTNAEDINVDHRKALDYARGSSTIGNANASWCGRVSSGDIIRPHSNGNTGTAAQWAFSVFMREL